VKPHPLLFPLSWIYGIIVTLRNWFFEIGLLKSVDVGVPVISVGNITTGGTGKTPVVENIAKIFIASGKKVAVVSRGYGRKSLGNVVVSDGKNIFTNVEEAGDEPLFLAQQLQNGIVIVDEDRARGAKKAIEEFSAEMIILDDGFQHRYLRRNVDIVLMDADNMPFDSMLLPAGYRREPVRSLKRAHAVVLTKVENEYAAKEFLDRAEFNSIEHKFTSSYRVVGLTNIFNGVIQSLDMLKEHSVIALCGIAKPENFKKSVDATGAAVKDFLSYDDHHRFTGSDIDDIIKVFHNMRVDFIVTTEKDAVRLEEFKDDFRGIPVVALKMEVVIHQEDEWKKFLQKAITK